MLSQTDRTELTGYPSIDKPWLKYYEHGAYEAARDILQGKTIWDVMEQSLQSYSDTPVIEYFGRQWGRF